MRRSVFDRPAIVILVSKPAGFSETHLYDRLKFETPQVSGVMSHSFFDRPATVILVSLQQ
jgi:hypothetical protein